MAFSYEIEQSIGKLSESDNGDFTTEVNMISYNGARPKLDIRKWNRKEDRMLKGIALTWEETQILIDLLQDIGAGDFR